MRSEIRKTTEEAGEGTDLGATRAYIMNLGSTSSISTT